MLENGLRITVTNMDLSYDIQKEKKVLQDISMNLGTSVLLVMKLRTYITTEIGLL